MAGIDCQGMFCVIHNLLCATLMKVGDTHTQRCSLKHPGMP